MSLSPTGFDAFRSAHGIPRCHSVQLYRYVESYYVRHDGTQYEVHGEQRRPRREGLGKRYGDHWALRDLDVSTWPRGTVLGLLGHNGAGKTTGHPHPHRPAGGGGCGDGRPQPARPRVDPPHGRRREPLQPLLHRRSPRRRSTRWRRSRATGPWSPPGRASTSRTGSTSTGCWPARGPSGFIEEVHRLLGRVLGFPAYTVAAVNGHAFAGGAMLACAHDQIIMRADRGYWCLPEVDLGLPLTPAMYATVAAHVPAADGRRGGAHRSSVRRCRGVLGGHRERGGRRRRGAHPSGDRGCGDGGQGPDRAGRPQGAPLRRRPPHLWRVISRRRRGGRARAGRRARASARA